MEKEYRTSSIFYQYINIFESIVACAPTTIQCRYDLVIHGFDRAMTIVSIGMSQDLMVEMLISKFGVLRTISGFATYTYKQHHRIRVDILARK